MGGKATFLFLKPITVRIRYARLGDYPCHFRRGTLSRTAWLFLQSVLVNYRNAWDDLDEIQTRFIDALSWHSDAIFRTGSRARRARGGYENGRLVVR